MEDLQEGDLVLCTVKKIVGTTVFVDIEGGGEGTIVVSEISPGRIRNLRDYVVPNKKIVCKILRISKDKTMNLSLRRVTQKETKEIMEKAQKERSAYNILKTVLKQEVEPVAEKIKEQKLSLSEFLDQAKDNSEMLEKLIPKENAKKIAEILAKRKEKKKEVKKEFKFTTNSPDGITKIKSILKTDKVEITYLGSGKYAAKLQGEDGKKIKTDLNQVLEQIEEQAKKEKIKFEIKDK